MDGKIKTEYYLKDTYSDKWEHVDVKARSVFGKSKEGVIKCVARMSIHGNRIEIIDKNWNNMFFPLCADKDS